jgi:hypothetical protein
MSTVMEEDIKRRPVCRRAALVLDIVQGKATMAAASRRDALFL